VRSGHPENLLAGKTCPTCSGDDSYGRISDEGMTKLMKGVVNKLYFLVTLREENPGVYESLLLMVNEYYTHIINVSCRYWM